MNSSLVHDLTCTVVPLLIMQVLILLCPSDSMNFSGKKTGANSSVIRLPTLYHADKLKRDQNILELVVFLHRLINLVRYKDNGLKAFPVQSPIHKGMIMQIETQTSSPLDSNRDVQEKKLSLEDKNLLEEVVKQRKMVTERSKSQEFAIGRKGSIKVLALSWGNGSSPRRFLQPGHQKSSLLDIYIGWETCLQSYTSILNQPSLMKLGQDLSSAFPSWTTHLWKGRFCKQFPFWK